MNCIFKNILPFLSHLYSHDINYKMYKLAFYNNSQLPPLKIIYFTTNKIMGETLT